MFGTLTMVVEVQLSSWTSFKPYPGHSYLTMQRRPVHTSVLLKARGAAEYQKLFVWSQMWAFRNGLLVNVDLSHLCFVPKPWMTKIREEQRSSFFRLLKKILLHYVTIWKLKMHFTTRTFPKKKAKYLAKLLCECMRGHTFLSLWSVHILISMFPACIDEGLITTTPTWCLLSRCKYR